VPEDRYRTFLQNAGIYPHKSSQRYNVDQHRHVQTQYYNTATVDDCKEGCAHRRSTAAISPTQRSDGVLYVSFAGVLRIRNPFVLYHNSEEQE
jgi:hypothetical protein